MVSPNLHTLQVHAVTTTVPVVALNASHDEPHWIPTCSISMIQMTLTSTLDILGTHRLDQAASYGPLMMKMCCLKLMLCYYHLPSPCSGCYSNHEPVH